MGTQYDAGAYAGKPTTRRLRVAVLMGGTSSEREVSLATGRQIAAALDPAKYEVASIDTADLLTLASAPVDMQAIASHTQDAFASSSSLPAPAFSGRADIVFIALHGKGGEDGTVQGLLDFLGVPYTGSGVLASALAMNKSMTKRLLRAAGIPVIDGDTVSRNEWNTAQEQVVARIVDSIGECVFVKPNCEGSSVGGTLAQSRAGLAPAIQEALRFDEEALVERYTTGVEITVGVLEPANGVPEALPAVEIVPVSNYYDYKSKYSDGGSEHIIPARLEPAVAQLAQSYALRCHSLIGCRGVSRTDMIVTENGPVVLEVNTIPGMTATSLLPQAAASVGIGFTELLNRIISAALARCCGIQGGDNVR